MEPPSDPSRPSPDVIDISTGRAVRAPFAETTYGPLEDHELEFYAPLGDMGERVEHPDWDSGSQASTDHPRPDDPDAEANGALWTGEFWRPAGRVPRPEHTRTPICPGDFVMMEFTNVGWICPDCGVVQI